MRLMLIITLFLRISSALACSETLRRHPEECLSQDRFEKMREEFNKLSINITELKGLKISRALGPKEINLKRNALLNHTQAALADSKDWHLFQSGQSFIQNLRVVFLSTSDVLKLHKAMFAPKGLFNVASGAGQLRTFQGITNPSETISCEDKVINDEIIALFDDLDLKSDEGYPLLSLEQIKKCSQPGHYSAELVYYKGASVKHELNRWINDFNDMLIRYEKGSASQELAPLDYTADMRRWFIALSPFVYGNTEVANALTDYFLRRLDLVALPLKDLRAPQLYRPEVNRQIMKNRAQETLNFLESCLYENKVGPVSAQCSVF